MTQKIDRSLFVALALFAAGCGSNNITDNEMGGIVGEIITTKSGLIYVDTVIGEGHGQGVLRPLQDHVGQ